MPSQPDVFRLVYDAHASRAELFDDPVVGDRLPDHCGILADLFRPPLRPRSDPLQPNPKMGYKSGDAPVAQMDRALVSESKGRTFESSRAHLAKTTSCKRKRRPESRLFC